MPIVLQTIRPQGETQFLDITEHRQAILKSGYCLATVYASFKGCYGSLNRVLLLEFLFAFKGTSVVFILGDIYVLLTTTPVRDR